MKSESPALGVNRLIWLLALIIGAQPIATDLYLPAMPDLANSLPAQTWLGMSFASASSLTLFTLFYGLGQVAGGELSDRYGRRRTLVFALLAYTLCGLGAVFSPNMACLLVLRSIQGLATAAIVVTARAAIRDSYSVDEAPKVMSSIFAKIGLVVVLCPVVGAFLATHGGWRVAMAATTVYGAVMLAWCLWQFPETQKSTLKTTDSLPILANPSGWRLLQVLWASPSFRLWTLVASATIAGIFTFLTVSSSIFIGQFGFSAYAYGAALVGGALTFIGSNLWCAHLLQKHSIQSIAKLGAVLSLAGGIVQILALLCFSSRTSLALPLVLLLGQYLYALSHGMLQSCAMAASTADFPQMAGRASAWSGLTMMVIAFVVSQMAASWLDAIENTSAWPLAVTICVCGAALVALTFKSSARSN